MRGGLRRKEGEHSMGIIIFLWGSLGFGGRRVEFLSRED
jgi:hypothetical protein